MNIALDDKLEKAVRLLIEYVPEEKDRKKNIITHALRVGMYLYENNYSEDVVIAGFLHDIVEWTDSPQETLREEFGQHVLDIVLANTKDRNIEDKPERRRDMIERCQSVGKDALIVKAADTIDSYNFYRSANNPDETQRAIDIAKLLSSVVTQEEKDPIFDKLSALE